MKEGAQLLPIREKIIFTAPRFHPMSNEENPAICY